METVDVDVAFTGGLGLRRLAWSWGLAATWRWLYIHHINWCTICNDFAMKTAETTAGYTYITLCTMTLGHLIFR